MIKKLKKRLSFLFVSCIMVIFTLAFSLFIHDAVQSERESQKHYFERMTMLLVYQLESTDDYFGALKAMENSNGLILQLRGNNNTLLYQSISPDTDSIETLMDTFSSELRKVKINSIPTGIIYSTQSGTFTFPSGRNGLYYGIKADIATNSGELYQLYCLSAVNNAFLILKGHILFYIAIWLIAFAAILLLSKYLIRKAATPTESAMQGQKEFIAAVSHELKAPLATILTSSELIGRKCKLPDDIKKSTDIINLECMRMSKLIQNLLLLSSIDAHTWTLNKVRINADNLLISLYEKVEPRCSFKNLYLKLDMNDELLPSLTADEERICQILEILIDNAVNYSPSGSEIQLGADVKKNIFSFYVIDHGAGIKEEDKPFIYDRFYCADKSRTQRDHYGLGLSIAKELVKMHGGTITLSDTPGGGCTFRVSFPLNEGRIDRAKKRGSTKA